MSDDTAAYLTKGTEVTQKRCGDEVWRGWVRALTYNVGSGHILQEAPELLGEKRWAETCEWVSEATGHSGASLPGRPRGDAAWKGWVRTAAGLPSEAQGSP